MEQYQEPTDNVVGTPSRELPPVKPKGNSRKPKDSKKIPILAILAFVIPVTVFTIFSLEIIQADTQNHVDDHKTILELQAQLKAQNNTINNLNFFLTNAQMPLDCLSVLKLPANTTFQHCLDIMYGRSK